MGIELNSTSHEIFDDIFVQCHEDTMPISACQQLERYLMGAKVPKPILHVICKLKKIGGIGFLQRLVEEGKSPNTFMVAVGQYVRYTKQNNTKQLLYWCLNVDTAYNLKHYIQYMRDKNVLIKAVKNDKPLPNPK